MGRQPELSIITVNYNGLKDTEQLIGSLRKFLDVPYELIVVDNGSTENEAAVLQKRYSFVKTIRSEKNLGFAGGNNLAIGVAGGDFLFFINNDAFVLDSSLSALIERMRVNPYLGGVSPKIMFADKGGGIQFAGYTELSRITLRNHLIGYREKDSGQYDIPRPTPYMHGAAMLVRREAIEQAGVMPEAYFLYYEELEWSLQIRRKGYELEYNPSATVYHKESSTTGQDTPLKEFYMTRNRLLFARRNLPLPARIFSICYQLTVAIPKKLVMLLIKGRFALAKAVAKGCMAFLKIY